MPRPAPVCLLAGGPGSRRGGRDGLLAQALAVSSRPAPRVAYVGAPSDDNRVFFQMLAAMLRAAGAGRVDLVRLAGRRADVDASRRLLDDADLVFVTGGDVERGMEVIGSTGIARTLNDRYKSGVPFVGISAGSIVLARGWIRWSDPDDDTTAALFDCLGYAPVYCDTHGEAEDWPELKALLHRSPRGTVGYGIPTNRALRVTPDGGVTALGGEVHRFRRAASGVTRIEDLTPG